MSIKNAYFCWCGVQNGYWGFCWAPPCMVRPSGFSAIIRWMATHHLSATPTMSCNGVAPRVCAPTWQMSMLRSRCWTPALSTTFSPSMTGRCGMVATKLYLPYLWICGLDVYHSFCILCTIECMSYTCNLLRELPLSLSCYKSHCGLE